MSPFGRMSRRSLSTSLPPSPTVPLPSSFHLLLSSFPLPPYFPYVSFSSAGAAVPLCSQWCCECDIECFNGVLSYPLSLPHDREVVVWEIHEPGPNRKFIFDKVCLLLISSFLPSLPSPSPSYPLFCHPLLCLLVLKSLSRQDQYVKAINNARLAEIQLRYRHQLESGMAKRRGEDASSLLPLFQEMQHHHQGLPHPSTSPNLLSHLPAPFPPPPSSTEFELRRNQNQTLLFPNGLVSPNGHSSDDQLRRARRAVERLYSAEPAHPFMNPTFLSYYNSILNFEELSSSNSREKDHSSAKNRSEGLSNSSSFSNSLFDETSFMEVDIEDDDPIED